MKSLLIKPVPRATVELSLNECNSNVEFTNSTEQKTYLLGDACRYYDDYSRANELCQYYTHDIVAEVLYEVFKRYFCPESFLMVEPSAGRGAFSKLLPPGSIAVDLDPKSEGIDKQDFLQYELPTHRPIAVIGNPPFGKNSAMARRFVERTTLVAQVFAMILPRTARKLSFQKCIPLNFHLVHDGIVPAKAFFFKGRRVDVPTVFQIWERRDCERHVPEEEYTHPDFTFLRTALGADFAIQRVGSNAGRVHHDFSLSPESHYFIKCAHPAVEQVMRTLDFASVAADTAGNPSLATPEIIRLYRASTGR